MTDKLIFPWRVYILRIWTADLALTRAEVSVSCLLMLMCSWLEMNGSVIEIYLYSSYMAATLDPGHCISLWRAPASVRGSQQMTLLRIYSAVQCYVCHMLWAWKNKQTSKKLLKIFSFLLQTKLLADYKVLSRCIFHFFFSLENMGLQPLQWIVESVFNAKNQCDCCTELHHCILIEIQAVGWWQNCTWYGPITAFKFGLQCFDPVSGR